MNYPYTRGDRFEDPESYEYTSLQGPAFFDDFYQDRQTHRDWLDTNLRSEEETIPQLSWIARMDDLDLPASHQSVDEFIELEPPKDHDPIQTDGALDWCLFQLSAPEPSERAWELIEKFSSRFEIKKKLYENYDNWRGDGSVAGMGTHVKLALCLGLAYLRSERLPFLNCLLKLNDSIGSVREQLQDDLALEGWKWALRMEKKALDKLGVEADHGSE